MNLQDVRTKAKQFFSELNLESADGYLVYFDGVEVGWTRELDRPKSWRPNSLAINQAGDVYKVVGGDDYHGATEWRKVTPLWESLPPHLLTTQPSQSALQQILQAPDQPSSREIWGISL